MTESEPPFNIALRLARLRDRSVGQVDEVEALLDALTSSERMLKLSNDSLVRVINRKKSLSPAFIQQSTFEILTDTIDALSRFFDAKTTRIKLILDYLKLAGRNMDKELQQLRELELLYGDVKQEYERIKYEFMKQPLSKYKAETINDFKSFQDVISTKGIATMKRLKELERSLEEEIMTQISIFINANTVFDTKELYKLLLHDP